MDDLKSLCRTTDLTKETHNIQQILTVCNAISLKTIYVYILFEPN